MNDIFYYKILKYLVQIAHNEKSYIMKRNLRCISKRAKHIIDNNYDFLTPIPKNADLQLWTFLEMNLANQPIFVVQMVTYSQMNYTCIQLIHYFSEINTAIVHDDIKPLSSFRRKYEKTHGRLRTPLIKCANFEYAECLIILQAGLFLKESRIKEVLKKGGIVINIVLRSARVNKFCKTPRSHPAAILDE